MQRLGLEYLSNGEELRFVRSVLNVVTDKMEIGEEATKETRTRLIKTEQELHRRQVELQEKGIARTGFK